MRKIETKKGTWMLEGIEVIPSDSQYIAVKDAIEKGTLSEEYLQKETGHRAPITIDIIQKYIYFHRF